MHRRTIGILTLLAALIAPASAQAARECAKSATVAGGVANVTHFDHGPAEGHPLVGKTIRRRSGFYKAEGPVTLRYVGNRYSIQKGAIFKIVCYGKSPKAGAVLPALDLLQGTVKMKTAARKPGGVVTTEGLIDPRQDPTMTIQVGRRLRDGEPDAEALLNWFAGYIHAPLGTTRVSTRGRANLGVTPYVGNQRGVCIYLRRVKLTSKGTKNGYFTGTVVKG